MGSAPGPEALFTIGHSNLALEPFLGLLQAHGIRHLADIRRYPGSKRWPWFGKDVLPESLRERGIAYRHFPALGGRRAPAPDSPNGAWRVAQFRAFADYMDTPDFHAALDDLLALRSEGPVAAMCAEALPWRCHRNLVSDSAVVREVPVFHILSKGALKPHSLPAFARVDRTAAPPRITYPPSGEAQVCMGFA